MRNRELERMLVTLFWTDTEKRPPISLVKKIRRCFATRSKCGEMEHEHVPLGPRPVAVGYRVPE